MFKFSVYLLLCFGFSNCKVIEVKHILTSIVPILMATDVNSIPSPNLLDVTTIKKDIRDKITTRISQIIAKLTESIAREPLRINPEIFVSRQTWGALPSNDTTPILQPVEYVVIHHTYIPPVCWNQAVCSKSMRSMQNYHISLGWGDIGYNFCLGADGKIYEGRGWDVRGIHAGAANSRSMGICLIGDWRLSLPPKDMLDHTKDLIREGIEIGVINKDYKLIGHMQSMATECPGGSLQNEISTWDHYFPGNITFY